MTTELSRLERITAWQWVHNSAGFDLIRMFLGAALFVRGAYFALNPDALVEMAGGRVLDWTSYYVMIAHTAGGLLLLLGLLTRFGALIQIPILVSAVFFVDIRIGLGSGNQSLELSALVLMILAVILVYGPGRLSLAYRRFQRNHAEV